MVKNTKAICEAELNLGLHKFVGVSYLIMVGLLICSAAEAMTKSVTRLIFKRP